MGAAHGDSAQEGQTEVLYLIAKSLSVSDMNQSLNSGKGAIRVMVDLG